MTIALALLPAVTFVMPSDARAGRYKVATACGAVTPINSGGGSHGDNGLFRRDGSGTWENTISCASGDHWNATDPGRWGYQVSRTAEPTLNFPHAFSYDFIAPGNKLYKDSSGPDAGYDGETNIVEVTFSDRDSVLTPGGPWTGAGMVIARGSTNYPDIQYRVGIVANDRQLIQTGNVSGDAPEAMVLGCREQQEGYLPSEWNVNGHSGFLADCRIAAGPVQIADANTVAVAPDPRKITGAISFTVACPGRTPAGFSYSCANAGSAAQRANFVMHGARFTVEDLTPPDVTVAGPLLNDTAAVGVIPVTVGARDLIGLDRVDVVANGRVIGGLDYPCPNMEDKVVTSRLPCADRARVDQVPIDTAPLPDGRYVGAVRVYDVLGNVTDVPITFLAINNGEVELRVEGITTQGIETEIVQAYRNGKTQRCRTLRRRGKLRRVCGRTIRPGARFERNGLTGRRWKARIVSGSGPVIHAKLRRVSGKRGIGDVPLAVFERRPDGVFERRADITTRRDGSFRYKKGGPKREFSFVYRGGDGNRGSMATALGRVRSRATFSVSPRRARNRGRVRFRGRVVSGPLPSNGAQVVLQVRVRGEWRTFDTTRTRRNRGSFAASYRFTNTRRPTLFRFRVVIPRQRGYAYEAGRSRHQLVLVRR